jgi:hypothetical protein
MSQISSNNVGDNSQATSTHNIISRQSCTLPSPHGSSLVPLHRVHYYLCKCRAVQSRCWLVVAENISPSRPIEIVVLENWLSQCFFLSVGGGAFCILLSWQYNRSKNILQLMVRLGKVFFRFISRIYLFKIQTFKDWDMSWVKGSVSRDIREVKGGIKATARQIYGSICLQRKLVLPSRSINPCWKGKMSL